jgi:aspartyl-tRNA(Asn)/glutamyl-tRNA(Gln) amidotransferase subunit C
MNKEEVKKIAKLAKIEIPNDKIDDMVYEFSKTIEMIDKLNEVDCEDLEPLINVHDALLRMRADKVSRVQKDVLNNRANKSSEEFFSVPKVVQST